MSGDLDLVSQVMYLQLGEVNPGEEAKVARLEIKISDWQRDVRIKKQNVHVYELNKQTKVDISGCMVELENNFE